MAENRKTNKRLFIILFALFLMAAVAKIAITSTSYKGEERIVQDNLCPSGWKKTNLALRDYHANVFDDWVRVEVCDDNGIIRIEPGGERDGRKQRD